VDTLQSSKVHPENIRLVIPRARFVLISGFKIEWNSLSRISSDSKYLYNFIAMFLSVTILLFSSITIREIIKLQIAYNYDKLWSTCSFFSPRKSYLESKATCYNEVCHISLLKIFLLKYIALPD
jgi:hypothetical protein